MLFRSKPKLAQKTPVQAPLRLPLALEKQAEKELLPLAEAPQAEVKAELVMEDRKSVV